MKTVLQVEDGERGSIAELLEDGGEHHQAETGRIAGDDQERKLPGEPGTEKSIVEAWVGDGGRIVAADQVEHEVKGAKIKMPQMKAT